MRVGLISDTHGQLRPEVFTHLAHVEHILHAGDIGSIDILTELEALAPVTAVHGNTDDLEVRSSTPERVVRELAGLRLVLTHGHTFGSPTPQVLVAAYPGSDLIVYGHTHRPAVELVGRTLVVNPGSAGPQRFRINPSIALLELTLGLRPLQADQVRFIEL